VKTQRTINMGEGETTMTPATSENGGATSPEKDLIIAPIEVIIPADLSDAEDESDSEAEAEESRKKVKKTKKKKDGKKKMDKTLILTKTMGQALRLINEQKQKAMQKEKEEKIRNMALEQKARQNQAGRGGPVLIHI